MESARPKPVTGTVGGDSRGTWAAAVPAVVRDLEERWAVRVGEPFPHHGRTAWVAPATTGQGIEVVVKVVWPHVEAEHEPDALALWDGNGAVRLLAAERLPQATALLLERCRPGTGLSDLPERDQDPVIAELLGRLWVTPPLGHVFRPLQSMCEAWADEFEGKTAPDPGGVDAGLVAEGIALLRSLPASSPVDVVLCTDLHAGNVLAATREPWLAIDPKPYVGDPAYDVIQHLLNCGDRLHADPRAVVSRMAELAELDADRVLLWLFARCVQESHQWPDLLGVARAIAPS